MTVALIYHDVVDPQRADAAGFASSNAARYKLSPARFESHLDAIAETGIEVGLLTPGRPAPRATLTFDDGGSSAPEIADALERRGWRGHFFITTGLIGTRGFLDRDGIGELARRGHSVGSHSHTHPTYMGRLPRQELDREWRLSRELLGEALGEAPWSASLPGGFLSRRVLASAAAIGYSLLFTSQPTTRPRTRDGLTAQGRFAIWAHTSPDRIAAYVRGETTARLGLWLSWNAKTTAKRLLPNAYERLRGGH